MKLDVKNIVKNSVIVFGINFILLFLYCGYEDYSYYSSYSKESLSEFFSLGEVLAHNAHQSFLFSLLQMIVVIPTLIILEKKKIKNSRRILITIGITFITSIIYILLNFSL